VHGTKIAIVYGISKSAFSVVHGNGSGKNVTRPARSCFRKGKEDSLVLFSTFPSGNIL
jgi:hypothetical protein